MTVLTVRRTFLTATAVKEAESWLADSAGLIFCLGHIVGGVGAVNAVIIRAGLAADVFGGVGVCFAII